MRHAITVGMGFGKKSLVDAITSAKADDVIIVDPGEYTAENGFNAGNLEIRGSGNGPGDVVLHTTFTVKPDCTFKVSNLTLINDKAKSNAVNVRKGSYLKADRVVFGNQETEGKYPAVFLRGTGSLTACEAWHANAVQNGLYATEGAQVRLTQCDITGAYSVSSRIEVISSQVRGYLSVEKNGSLEADTLYLAEPHPGWYLVSVTGGSELKTGNLVIPEGQHDARVTASRFVADQTNIEGMVGLKVQLTENGDVNVPGAAIVQPQPAATGEDAVQADADEDIQDDGQDDSDATQDERDDAAETQDAQEELPAIEQLHNMIGLTALKKQVDAFIKVAMFNKRRAAEGAKTSAQSLHSLFLGNPGTGKTTVARLVAKVMQENGVMPSSNYVEVSRQDLVSDNVGGTALKTQRVLESAKGGVLFIDEAYTLYQAGGVTNWGQEAVDTILKYMEDHRDDLMIIFAGYTKEMKDFMNMNPGLTSRAPNVFDFEDYTPEEIAEIGIMGLRSQEYRFDEDYYRQAVMKAFAADVDNSNGRWVRNFNDKLIQTFVMGLPMDAQGDQLFDLTNDVIDAYTGGGEDEKAARVDALLEELNGMIGLTSVKTFVNDLVTRIRLEKELDGALPEDNKPTYHMIFSGAPGTGKTTVARLLAKLFYNLGILPKDTVDEVARPDLVGRYVGETEEKTSKAIRDALGGVLFVDEAYQLTNTGSGNDFGKEAVETFITALENHRDQFVGIFAGYTSDMADFLEANEGLRSRIPLTLEFEDYTPEEVAEIVYAIVTKRWSVNEDLIKSVVAAQYQALPAAERSNGRWARNYADKLIADHKLWLVDQLAENPDLDVTQIQDSELVPDDAQQGAKDEAVDALLAELNGMIGLTSVKSFVNDLVARIRLERKLSGQLPDSKPTYHMVFSGEPGTGKTTVARLIAKLFYNLGILPKNTVMEVARPDLVGQYIGQTEAKTAKILRDAMGGVLFVDEAYQLTNTGSGNDFGKEAVETFITALENNRDQFVAIFAGYTADMDNFLAANAGLRSRIPLTLEFEAYSPEEIAQIVTAIVTANWQVNEALLSSVVINRYKKLPANARSNGRWARNFADQLIAQHKLWLGQQDLDAPGFEVKQIQDDLLFESISW